MASFGHVAVGLLAGRMHGGAPDARERRCSWGAMSAFAALALLPDADVIFVALGANDDGILGHRGASHSLSVAVAVGLLAALAARRFGWPVMRTAIACGLAVASHALLDVLGHGGRGLPLLWPLSGARFESPWRIFPDAPRGLNLLSWRGVADLAIEFTLFMPITACALWQRFSDRAWPWHRESPELTMIAGGGAPAPIPIPIPVNDTAPLPDEQDSPLRSSA